MQDNFDLNGYLKNNPLLKENIEITDDQIDIVSEIVPSLPKNKLKKLLQYVGDLEIFKEGAKEMGFSYLDPEFIGETISQSFEDKDYLKYYNALKELNYI